MWTIHPIKILNNGELQGQIQDLKLGVAQMDWKIWKKGGGGTFQVRFLYIYIYFKYDIFQMLVWFTVYIKAPYTIL